MDNTEFLITVPENENKEPDSDLSIALPTAAPEVLMRPNICVIGVGGAGGNAINNMIRSHLTGTRFVVANTDAQVMSRSLTHERIQLGASLTQGLGAGSNPDIGRKAAEESLDKIKEALQGVNLLFIAAGMGGGTGTGASPVIAKLAKEMGILTIGVVTKPFLVENKKRMRIAEAGIEELSKYVDTLIIIPNQNLFLVASPQTTLQQAFQMADDILYQGVRSITDLMIDTMEVHVDFADVRAVTEGMGKAIMGSGEAEGENRAVDAVEKVIVNPLLDVSMKGAKGVLIGFFGKNVLLTETADALDRIRQEVDEDANIIFGVCNDDTLGDKLRISVVATGLNEIKDNKAPETAHVLSNIPEPIVITPQGHEQLQEAVQEQEPPKKEQSVLFVPAPNSPDIVVSTQTVEIAENVQPKVPEDTFIAEPAAKASPALEEQMHQEQDETDLFPPLLKSLNVEASQTLAQADAAGFSSMGAVGGTQAGIGSAESTKGSAQESTQEGVNKKRKGLFSDVLFPSIFSDKNMIEKSKKRLQAQAEQRPNTERTVPELPQEEELNIPAFLR